MKRKKIYISLPITGREDESRKKADMIKASLSRSGYDVVNPFDIYCGKKPNYKDYLCCDLRALADCDMIYLCNDWEQSRGCRIEYNFAKEFKIQIVFEDSQFQD